LVLNRFVPKDQGRDSDLVMRAMTTAATILTFVLGFSIVQAKFEFTRVQEGINVEARTLGELDRMLLRFDPARTSAARETLAQYVNTVIVDEWPLLRQQNSSRRAGEFVRQLTRQIEELEPQPGKQQGLFQELIRAATAVENRRNERVFQADNSRLPTMFWVVILVALGALGTVGAFLKPTKITITMLAAQAAMFGILTAFLFILDERFMGETSVTPDPFARVYGALSESTKSGVLPAALREEKDE
jgi:hypothetical protein